MNNKVSRILVYVVGLYILAIGIDLMIIADLGTGAWDALNVGLNKHFGLTVGTWAQIVGIVVIFVNAYLKKKLPEILPFLTMYILGSFIDLNLRLLQMEISNTLIAIITMLIGLLLMSIGIALYLQAKFGLNPVDGLVMIIKEKMGWSLRSAKTSAELGAFILAFILGGSIGIGTILVTFLIGPLLQFFYKKFEKWLKLVY